MERGVPEAENSTVRGNEPITAPVGGRGGTDNWPVELYVPKVSKRGGAKVLDRAVSSHDPVPRGQRGNGPRRRCGCGAFRPGRRAGVSDSRAGVSGRARVSDSRAGVGNRG